MNIALWVLQGVLALAFLSAGAMKTIQAIPVLAKSLPWTAEVPMPLVRFIGISEVAGGLGLILPGITKVQPILTVYAAVGLAVVMLLGALFHISRKEFSTIAPSVILLILSVVVVIGRSMWSPL